MCQCSKWSSLKQWLSDNAKYATLYDASKIYEYVLQKMQLMEQNEKRSK